MKKVNGFETKNYFYFKKFVYIFKLIIQVTITSDIETIE